MLKISFALVLGSAVAACGSSSDSTGNAAAIEACDLLTHDEILQATGAAVGPGLLQTTDNQASCDWNAPDGSTGAVAVGVAVQNFDAALWNTDSSSIHATPVMGIGEEAYKGYPHSGDLSVKRGSYEIDVGIIDFTDDTATVDAETLQLTGLVLPRV